MIASDVSGRRDELAIDFRPAQPFRHVVIENFLEPNRAVATWVPPQRSADQEFDIAIDKKCWHRRVANGASATLDFARAARAKVAPSICASQTFMPNRDDVSSDDRVSAWRLVGVVPEHK